MSRAVYEQFRVQVKQEILQKLDCGLDFSDGQVRRLIDERLCRSDCIGRLDVVERRKLGRELFAAIRGFDVLQELLEDKRITEIMVNGPDRIFIEKDGRLTQWQGRFESPARLLDVIQQIAAGCNRVVNEASPILDARLSDGSRVNVVLSPVALNGPAMTNRGSGRGNDAGQAGGAWVDYRRMQKLSRTVGKVPVQHFYQRGYGERKDDVFKCAVAGDSAGGTNRDDRGQRRAAVKICAKSGFSRNQKRQHGGMQNDFRAGSDPQQFKNAAGSDYRRRSSRCRDL